MKIISRRNAIKVGAGLFAFIPAANSLLSGKTSFAQTNSLNQVTVDQPGQGTLAGLNLGDDLAAITAKLGKPKREQQAHGNGSLDCEFDGVRVRFLRATSGKAQVGQIVLTGSIGSINGGLKVGSKVADLKQVYGENLIDYGPGGYGVDLATAARLGFEHNSDVITAIILQDIGCTNCKSAPSGPKPSK